MKLKKLLPKNLIFVVIITNGITLFGGGLLVDAYITDIKADHTHCIPERDIVTMDRDQYDYFRVSIGDVDYSKYAAMEKRINYTYADQEKDIATRKE